jgi:TolB-like protein/tetratricopeptide (TPR) repeat protein
LNKLKHLLLELRRRRVYRMTAIYIVAAWVAVQIASEALPALNIPEGAIRYVWVAVLVGFPVAVLFSWRYDITASGIRRTPAAHEDMTAVGSLTRVDYGILAVLATVVLATVFGAGQRLIEVQTKTAQAPTTREIDPNSIAVLPFESLSPNPDDAYFAAGVHNSLITSLGRITALMVTSRTSTLRINSELSVPEIGRRLGVAKLLEGSVLMDGDRVQIIVQLIEAATDLPLWANTYEREVSDIISLQNEVARTIADVIEIRLTPREEVVLAEAPKVRPDTYRAYLKGMFQLSQETPEADRRGIEILEEAVRRDPTSALAHAGLAISYANLAHTPMPVENAYPKAKSAADIALQLDSDLAEAHLAVGMYKEYYEWDVKGAEKAFKRAIELNPNLAWAHYHLAWLYEILGPEREEESLAHGDRTRELNPLSAYMVAWLGDQYRDACLYDEALHLAREAIRLNPEHPIGWAILGWTYAELGQFDEAIDAHRRLVGTPWVWFLGMSYAAAGLEDKAREVIATLEQYPGTELPLAVIYTQMGDRESTLHWIAEAEKAKTPWYLALLVRNFGTGLIADDPDVQERAAELGLPDPRTMGCGI